MFVQVLFRDLLLPALSLQVASFLGSSHLPTVYVVQAGDEPRDEANAMSYCHETKLRMYE